METRLECKIDLLRERVDRLKADLQELSGYVETLQQAVLGLTVSFMSFTGPNGVAAQLRRPDDNSDGDISNDGSSEHEQA